jgi:hypothetical protein
MGRPPNHINVKKLKTKIQNKRRVIGRYLELLIFTVPNKDSGIRISRALNIANTPKSLFGILLRIQYIGKKYHSGTIVAGVIYALA